DLFVGGPDDDEVTLQFPRVERELGGHLGDRGDRAGELLRDDAADTAGQAEGRVGVRARQVVDRGTADLLVGGGERGVQDAAVHAQCGDGPVELHVGAEEVEVSVDGGERAVRDLDRTKAGARAQQLHGHAVEQAQPQL